MRIFLEKFFGGTIRVNSGTVIFHLDTDKGHRCGGVFLPVGFLRVMNRLLLGHPAKSGHQLKDIRAAIGGNCRGSTAKPMCRAILQSRRPALFVEPVPEALLAIGFSIGSQNKCERVISDALKLANKCFVQWQLNPPASLLRQFLLMEFQPAFFDHCRPELSGIAAAGAREEHQRHGPPFF
ncbi:MAG TPA: hypothetical protein VMS78_06610 [Rhizomicrobium sp.]|nr:hypothetical protein [Rhizomicrobium sp.]